MKKHEVLSLLERFPDLVDSDDLATDLYRQACDDTKDDCVKPPDSAKTDRRDPAEPHSPRPR